MDSPIACTICDKAVVLLLQRLSLFQPGYQIPFNKVPRWAIFDCDASWIKTLVQNLL